MEPGSRGMQIDHWIAAPRGSLDGAVRVRGTTKTPKADSHPSWDLAVLVFCSQCDPGAARSELLSYLAGIPVSTLQIKTGLVVS